MGFPLFWVRSRDWIDRRHRLAQEKTADPDRQTSRQQAPPQAFPAPIRVTIVEDQSTTDARYRDEEESRQREIADLAAQEGMNSATQAIKDATLDMRDFTQTSTWLVGIGTGLLVVTLALT